MNTFAPVVRGIKKVITVLDYASPVIDVVIRLWIAEVFFQSGLVKITSWQSTLALFENEYQVPLLPPLAAAYLGTAVELVFPVLLALGLARVTEQSIHFGRPDIMAVDRHDQFIALPVKPFFR